MNVNITIVIHPFIHDLIVEREVFLGTGTVNDVYSAVAVAIMSAVIDHGTHRSHADATCNNKQIMSRKLVVHRECVTVWSANCDLLTGLDHVKPVCQASAFFDLKFKIILVCGR